MLRREGHDRPVRQTSKMRAFGPPATPKCTTVNDPFVDVAHRSAILNARSAARRRAALRQGLPADRAQGRSEKCLDALT
jgi:hypothetical protein